MNIDQLLEQNLFTFNTIANETFKMNKEALIEVSGLFTKTLKNHKKIFWCGNGGSASESSHLATELIGRFKSNRKSLPSISLAADSTALSCIANDFGYEEVFSRQLSSLGAAGDLLIVLSTSGNSQNILRALEKSKEMSITCVALLGGKGGHAAGKADYQIIVPSQETARIQEVHLMIGHTLCEIAEIELGLS